MASLFVIVISEAVHIGIQWLTLSILEMDLHIQT